jgi:hypothetical protein
MTMKAAALAVALLGLAVPRANAQGDPLSLPFPENLTADALYVWVTAAKAEGVRQISAAQGAGDRDEVSRVLIRLEKVRQHSLRELRRLRAEAAVPEPATPPAAPDIRLSVSSSGAR